MRYGPDFCKDVTLSGGERVRIRLVRPDDKDRLEAGLLRLSAESAYLRFFTAKARFTSSELEYLTEVDGDQHFAIGATMLEGDGTEGDGVGVARFVRLPGEPMVAEPAVAVIDDMQRRGIGSMLMRHLVAAAKERGIEVFRTELLTTNDRARELVASLAPQVRYETRGPVATAEFSLVQETALAVPEAAEASEPASRLVEALATAAKHGLELRRRFEMLLHPGRLLETLRRLGRRE